MEEGKRDSEGALFQKFEAKKSYPTREYVTVVGQAYRKKIGTMWLAKLAKHSNQYTLNKTYWEPNTLGFSSLRMPPSAGSRVGLTCLREKR